MTILLVQSCSKSKNIPDSAIPALELYSGYFFKIIKKAIRERAFRSDIHLVILSAKHGLIDATTEIGWYDQQMDIQRAEELRSEVTATLQEWTTDEYDKVVVNVGEIYKQSIKRGLAELDIDVHYIQGDGIGVKGSRLKKFIRDDVDASSLEMGNMTGSL